MEKIPKANDVDLKGGWKVSVATLETIHDKYDEVGELCPSLEEIEMCVLIMCELGFSRMDGE